MTQGAPTNESELEHTVRRRLRSLRSARGWTLDELARRSNIGPSTISRIETGHRRVALDQLVSLARALETTVDELTNDDAPDDVVIRPERHQMDGATVWHLSRREASDGPVVAKIRFPARTGRPTPQVHPGRDWFYVLEGTARLLLGEHEHLVEAGQAAEFDTMQPHWIGGYRGPVEVLTIFDRHGERAHLPS